MVQNNTVIQIPTKIIETCRLIHLAGLRLRLNPPIVCTAIAYYHRCTKREDEKPLLLQEKYSENTIAATCLFLAAKVGEDARRLREVLTTVHKILDPDVPFLDLNSEYFRLKEELVGCEQLVLRTLCFDTTYDDRHKLILHYIHWLKIRENHPKVAQVAYSLMTDATYSPFLCHECPKRALSVACIMVAVDIMGKDCATLFPPGLLPWYTAFGARPLDVMAGYHHLLQLIKQCSINKKKEVEVEVTKDAQPGQEEVEVHVGI